MKKFLFYLFAVLAGVFFLASVVSTYIAAAWQLLPYGVDAYGYGLCGMLIFMFLGAVSFGVALEVE